jgi:hypothetical protein
MDRVARAHVAADEDDGHHAGPADQRAFSSRQRRPHQAGLDAIELDAGR